MLKLTSTEINQCFKMTSIFIYVLFVCLVMYLLGSYFKVLLLCLTTTLLWCSLDITILKRNRTRKNLKQEKKLKHEGVLAYLNLI